MPSTPLPDEDFHDGFDSFFSDDEEALPSMSLNAETSSKNSHLASSSQSEDDEEALPQLDLSAFTPESTNEFDDEDAETYDDEEEDEEEEKEEDEYDSWDEEDPDYENTVNLDEEETEAIVEPVDDEDWQDEEDNSQETYSDDELDALLNFDDESWMDEGEESSDKEPLDEADEEEELVSLEDDEAEEDFIDYDDSDEDSEEEDEEDSDEDDVVEEVAPQKPAKKAKGSSPWKAKFEDFKRKAQAEMKGKEAEEKEPDEELDEDIDEEPEPIEEDESLGEEDAGEGGETSPSNNSSSRGGSSRFGNGLRNIGIVQTLLRILNMRPFLFLGRLLRPLKNAYLFVVNTILKSLEWILGLLGRLPVVGKPFRALRDLTNILRYIATCIPVMLILGLVFYLNHSAVPPKADTAMPDSGHLSISSMSFDSGSKTAKGTILNDGEIIAKVQPKFTVYSSSVLNPISWAFPKKRIECVGPIVKLEAGESKTVEAKCPKGAGGLLKKTTATLVSQ